MKVNDHDSSTHDEEPDERDTIKKMKLLKKHYQADFTLYIFLNDC